ncbi:hypothetical protein PCC7424_3449 [Gloeothece citriformis PCC 7424]|uniref:Uncharacterized protein n=1 Tax=Gloeothece citriformis (strain PCC 7424) TaxID=65393 RepID=B7KFC7_GLOC7|nr:hypothetical protein PCC7424_3449 [Gloeothece citriformis PCC 7424]
MSEESIDLGNWYKLKKKWVIPTLTAYLVSHARETFMTLLSANSRREII